MLSSQHYRAKAAQYKIRACNTENPAEIREFKNMEKTFAALADNEEWMEQNSANVVHSPTKNINDG